MQCKSIDWHDAKQQMPIAIPSKGKVKIKSGVWVRTRNLGTGSQCFLTGFSKECGDMLWQTPQPQTNQAPHDMVVSLNRGTKTP